jgi:hypothetical protein
MYGFTIDVWMFWNEKSIDLLIFSLPFLGKSRQSIIDINEDVETNASSVPEEVSRQAMLVEADLERWQYVTLAWTGSPCRFCLSRVVGLLRNAARPRLGVDRSGQGKAERGHPSIPLLS